MITTLRLKQKLRFVLLLAVILGMQELSAQITMTTTSSHSQNFDGLANTGSTNIGSVGLILPSWYSQRSGSGTTYAADTGSGNGGNAYSYGSAGNTDRAMGSLGSGNAAAGHFAHGVLLRNTSATTITDLRITYTLEQWRTAGNVSAQPITFWYKISNDSFTALNPNSNGTWTQVTALTLSSPINTGTAGALVGNNPANRVTASNVSIPGLSLLNNQYIMLKWEDPDNSGTDHGLAIDDVTINWTIAPISTPPKVITTTASNITTTSADAGGNVTDEGTASVTVRGLAYGLTANPTTGTTDGGGAGAFSSDLDGLTVNTHYFYRAYAISADGTSYGAENSFYTLANTPSAAIVENATTNSLDVSIGSDDGNPITTQYAIHETGGHFVQADGTLGAGPIWQTSASWGTKTVTSLNDDTLYTFEVVARNGDNAETLYGASASLSTLAITDPFLETTAADLDFGGLCLNTTAVGNFTVSGINLGSDITVGSLDGYSYATTAPGPFTSTLELTPVDGAISQTVFVQFMPTVAGSYDGNIPVSGGGATATSASATGSGIATVVSEVFTVAASSLTNDSATLNGNLAATAVCPDMTEKGFVYSLTADNNTPTHNGTGVTTTSVAGLTTGNFSLPLAVLSTATNYSFRAYTKDANEVYTYGDVLNFSTVATTPSAASNIVYGAYTANSIELSWTNGSGDNRIVVARTLATSAAAPANGNEYPANSTSFTDALNGTTGEGNVVIYNGSGNTVTVTDLPSGTYAFDIYEYNGNGITASYSPALSGIKSTLAAEATVQASNITFTNVSGTQMIINWTPGDGGNSLVVVKAGSAVDAIPVDGTNYGAANSNNPYTNGEQITPDNYVVYRASQSTLNVTGLEEGVTYHVAVFTFSGTPATSAVNYLTDAPATASVTAETPSFYSQNTGVFNTLENWNSERTGGGSTPANFTSGRFVIQEGHEMATNATVAFGAAGLSLVIEYDGVLTTPSAITMASGSSFVINDGGTYNHNNTGTPSTTIFNGTESFAADSTVRLNNWNSNTTAITTGVTLPYGNLDINWTGNSSNWQQGLSGNYHLCAGDLTITSVGTGSIRLTGSSAYAITIDGDLNINTTQQVTLASSSGSANVRNLFIGGNYNQTEGTLNTGSGSNTTINLIGTGAFSSTGTISPANINWVIGALATITMNNNLQLGSARTLTVEEEAMLIVGTNVISGQGTVLLNSGGITLGSDNPAGAIAGNITTTGGLVLQGQSGVIYGGQGNQTVTPRLDYAVLGLSGSGIKTFTGNTTASLVMGSVDTASAVVASGVTVSTPILIVDPEATFTLSNNASLMQAAFTNNSGNITVQRNSFLNRLDYVYWSSPVADQNLFDFSSLTLPNRFYGLNEGTNSFVTIDPAANDFIPGRGYMVRAPNTYLDYPAQKQLFVGEFTGTPNNGDYTVNTTNTGGGFNLIGNPYPSPVSAMLFLDENADVNALHFWAHQSLAGGGVNYGSYNRTGPVANDYNIVPNGFIQTGQGFLAEVENGGTVVFNNGMRVADTQDQFFRNAVTEQNRIWLNLSQETVKMNQTLIGYVENATNGLDGQYDAKLTDKEGSRLYSFSGARNLVIQGRALPFVNTDIVAMGFHAASAGNYTIAIDQVDGLFADGQDIFLNDLLTGTVHNLQEGAYSFASQAGDFASRFQLQFTNSTLGTDTPEIASDHIIVFGKNGTLTVDSGSNIMQSVKVFDIRGRLLYEQNDVNQTQTTFGIQSAQQVLVVQVTANGTTVSKKVVH